MKTKTLLAYRLADLKAVSPDGYERVAARWREGAHSGWDSDTLASLKAVVNACGFTLKDYSIGAHSHLSVRGPEEREDENGAPMTDRAWLEAKLDELGYEKDEKGYSFPGKCPFTGYCADEDFLQDVYMSVAFSGQDLKGAVEGLADKAREIMEDDLEQAQDEETMLANWDEKLYLPDGTEVE